MNAVTGRNSSNLNHHAILYIGTDTESTYEDDSTDTDSSNEHDSNLTSVDFQNSPSKNVYPTKDEPMENNRKERNRGFGVPLEKIPNWASYFNDQKNNIAYFSGQDVKMNYETCPDINRKVSIWFDDITMIKVDAVVNSLVKYIGVDGAIDRVPEQKLTHFFQSFYLCEVGAAWLTDSYVLPAKYLLHTNAPTTENPEHLESCYKNALTLLCESKLRTIAFPCIATVLAGYSPVNAAHVALRTVRKYLEVDGDNIDRVIFCLHHETNIRIYRYLMQAYFPLRKNVLHC